MEKQTWFDVTVLNPFTGKEETHYNIPRESLFLNEHCDIMIRIYTDEPTAVIMTHEVERDYFEYLNKLRESGVVNMFGASEYLEEEFDLDKSDAHKVLDSWMGSFSK